jgi:hypothetical protein
MNLTRYAESHYTASRCPRASAIVALTMDLWLEGRLHGARRAAICAAVRPTTRTEAGMQKAIEELRRRVAGTAYAAAPILQ